MFDIDETPIDNFIALSRQLDAQELGVELNAEDMDTLVAEIQDLQGYCGKLEAEVEILRRRCEKLKRDKKRLEWLVTHHGLTPVALPCRFSRPLRQRAIERRVFGPGYGGPDCGNVHRAIDISVEFSATV